MALIPWIVLASVLGTVFGATYSEDQVRDLRPDTMDLLRLLTDKPLLGLGSPHRWDRTPHVVYDVVYARNFDNERNYDDIIRSGSDKRSAVASALNGGRRRRQPTPALGKAVTPYVGVGVLNDMDTFFDSLRDNLQTLASLSPEERSTLFLDPPTVVNAPSAEGGGSGSGMRKLHALRPLRPAGKIRNVIDMASAPPEISLFYLPHRQKVREGVDLPPSAVIVLKAKRL